MADQVYVGVAGYFGKPDHPGKVGVFHAELQAQIADENVRARLRRQLPSNIFVQFLAGPIEVRKATFAGILRKSRPVSACE